MLISKEAERIFLEALERPAGERDTYVTDACRGDVRLREEVSSLLVAATDSESYFSGLAERVGLAALAGADEPLTERDQVGPWRLLRLIGRGGMGAVYLAERADGQFDKRAALKLLPVGIRDDGSRRRFLAERQILARLVHENITRLLDGGITEDGTPWFAMDYVEGRPIDRYCDEERLDTEARLALLLNVCDAVEYAHRNLVVHRDIKPGNVLVDESGRVRLLDFGIAKLQELEDEESPELTQLARRPMTPGYASPEMLLGRAVDVTTDVYSLGVLAYRLLTGEMPLEFQGLSSAEMERRALEQVPPPASQAARTADGADAIAAARRSDPVRLASRLRGDLDVVLATALAKEKEARYGSVELFSRDIRRHLDGLPILARAPTLGYRAGKFLRRHRAGVAVAALAAVSLVTVAALSVRFAIVTERQAEEIAAERDRAEEIKEFLQGVFEQADPSQSRGAEMTAREILRRGALRITEDEEQEPALKADLLETISYVYQTLALFAEARELTQEVASLRLETDGEYSESYAGSMRTLAFIHEMLGELQPALEYAERSTAIRRQLGMPLPLGDALLTRGRILQRLGRLEEAGPFIVEAVDLIRGAVSGPSEELASALHHLGALRQAQREYAEAEKLHREGLSIRLALHGKPQPYMVESYYNLGASLNRLGRREEALEALNRALAISRRFSPEGHPDQFYMLNELGRLNNELDRPEVARRRFSEAIEITERHYGETHPNAAIARYNLGRMLALRGDCASGIPFLRSAIDIYTAVSPDRLTIAWARGHLGKCLMALGETEEAESELLGSLAMLVEKRGDSHRESQLALQDLVALYERTGDTEQADEYRARLRPADPE